MVKSGILKSPSYSSYNRKACQAFKLQEKWEETAFAKRRAI